MISKLCGELADCAHNLRIGLTTGELLSQLSDCSHNYEIVRKTVTMSGSVPSVRSFRLGPHLSVNFRKLARHESTVWRHLDLKSNAATAPVGVRFRI
jgi:hypothetical protein